MISEIKKEIALLKGKNIKVKVDIGRNKIEEYEGIITGTYNNIWILKTKTELKSFGYTDLLIKSVIISS